MRVILIRHAEPDYTDLEQAGYTDFGLELAPLTERGRQMAAELARSPLLQEVEIVISSSVTRALETASYLVRYRPVPLFVEPFFHEWRVYDTGLKVFEEARTLFFKHEGALPENSSIRYETAVEIKERFLTALAKYEAYQTVAIVCHRMLMRQFVHQEKIDYGEIIEVEL